VHPTDGGKGGLVSPPLTPPFPSQLPLVLNFRSQLPLVLGMRLQEESHVVLKVGLAQVLVRSSLGRLREGGEEVAVGGEKRWGIGVFVGEAMRWGCLRAPGGKGSAAGGANVRVRTKAREQGEGLRGKES
jgi:hypothetical protein